MSSFIKMNFVYNDVLLEPINKNVNNGYANSEPNLKNFRKIANNKKYSNYIRFRYNIFRDYDDRNVIVLDRIQNDNNNTNTITYYTSTNTDTINTINKFNEFLNKNKNKLVIDMSSWFSATLYVVTKNIGDNINNLLESYDVNITLIDLFSNIGNFARDIISCTKINKLYCNDYDKYLVDIAKHNISINNTETIVQCENRDWYDFINWYTEANATNDANVTNEANTKKIWHFDPPYGGTDYEQSIIDLTTWTVGGTLLKNGFDKILENDSNSGLILALPKNILMSSIPKCFDDPLKLKIEKIYVGPIIKRYNVYYNI